MFITKDFTVEEVKNAKREMNKKIEAAILEFVSSYAITELDVKVYTVSPGLSLPIDAVTVD